ncbi:MAG: hypothetical protein DI591_12175, partial [Citromicrobium sp.]
MYRPHHCERSEANPARRAPPQHAIATSPIAHGAALRHLRSTWGGRAMLTKGDDYPVHQTAEPIAFAGTDRNFYDRYFFNGYAPD